MALAFCLLPNVLYISVKFNDRGFVFLVLVLKPFKIISLIMSRSLIRDERKPEYLEKKHQTFRCRTWHFTCDSSEARTTAVRDLMIKSQRSYPVGHAWRPVECAFFMPPTLKKLAGHIGLPSFVLSSVRSSRFLTHSITWEPCMLGF